MNLKQAGFRGQVRAATLKQLFFGKNGTSFGPEVEILGHLCRLTTSTTDLLC